MARATSWASSTGSSTVFRTSPMPYGGSRSSRLPCMARYRNFGMSSNSLAHPPPAAAGHDAGE
eukprot:11187568-Lingulodinium_polyedra.AAC.1